MAHFAVKITIRPVKFRVIPNGPGRLWCFHSSLGGWNDRAMRPLPSSHLRIARPSRDLRATERFWVDGLGLDVLYRADSSAEGGHALLMAGWPGAAWHLEFVDDRAGETPAAPTEEDLLVLYLDGDVDEGTVNCLVDAGGTRVASRNPYWDRGGVTIVDPDGYRLVLTSRSWS
jgi:catechol 2,3-dioxygenase-like lactoylglutathione lyase family enzyme